MQQTSLVHVAGDELIKATEERLAIGLRRLSANLTRTNSYQTRLCVDNVMEERYRHSMIQLVMRRAPE
ncbi:hypothetical protein WN73_07040 [Bradyrhizobium sp. CCBAU 45394]|nr:hypothetical protein [Bradyrhizobium sp. CCBAU 45394]